MRNQKKEKSVQWGNWSWAITPSDATKPDLMPCGSIVNRLFLTQSRKKEDGGWGHAAQLSSCPLGLSSVNSVKWYSRRHRSQKQWDPEMDYLIGWIYLYKDRILEEEKSRGGGIVGEHQAQYGDKGEWLTFSHLPDPHSTHPCKPIFSSPIQVTIVLCKSSKLFIYTQCFCDIGNEHQAGNEGPVSLSPFLLAIPCSRCGVENTFKFLLKCPGATYMNCLLLEAL